MKLLSQSYLAFPGKCGSVTLTEIPPSFDFCRKRRWRWRFFRPNHSWREVKEGSVKSGFEKHFALTALWTLQEYLRSWILCVPLCTELDAMVRKLMISLICFNIFQSKWYRNALIGVPNDKSKLREDCLYLLLQRGVHYITLFIYLCFMTRNESRNS